MSAYVENLSKELGYTFLTNLPTLLDQAEKEDKIPEVINQYFEQYKKENDYKKLTELVLLTNWKIWEHHDMGDDEVGRIYNDLWLDMDDWCSDNLHDEAATYYYKTTD